MNNSKPLIDLYLQHSRLEQEIITNLEAITGLKIESDSFPQNNSKIFLMSMEYSQGFEQGISLMWSNKLDINLNGKNIAQKLASALNVSILFDASLFEGISRQIINDDKWFIAKSDGVLRKVEIEILDDGINVIS